MNKENTHERPSFVTDEHLEYLDVLRQSGATNMWGAGPYVEEEFGVTHKAAIEIVFYWMKTFGNEAR